MQDNVNLDTLHEESSALRTALADVEAWVAERHTEMVRLHALLAWPARITSLRLPLLISL